MTKNKGINLKRIYNESRHIWEITTLIGIITALFLQIPNNSSYLKKIQALLLIVLLFSIFYLLINTWAYFSAYIRVRKKNTHTFRVNLLFYFLILICFFIYLITRFLIGSFRNELIYLSIILPFLFAPFFGPLLLKPYSFLEKKFNFGLLWFLLFLGIYFGFFGLFAFLLFRINI